MGECVKERESERDINWWLSQICININSLLNILKQNFKIMHTSRENRKKERERGKLSKLQKRERKSERLNFRKYFIKCENHAEINFKREMKQ